jgi:hypothetical protein
MAFYFDQNRPTSLDAISQYIDSYATPQAAEADTQANAPGGMNYLQKQYQNLTGDWFADPFKDASNAREDAISRLALSGASVAAGNPMGARITRMPQVSPIMSAVARSRVAATPPSIGGTLMPFQGPIPLRPNDAASATAPAVAPLQSVLSQSGPTPDIPQLVAPDDSGSPSSMDAYRKSLQERASTYGVYPDLEHIMRTNPDALHPANTGDPRFAFDAKGKPLAETDLAPIMHDPHFQKLERTDPTQARRLYHAVTNRDYDTDIAAKRAALTEQSVARNKAFENIKGLDYDPYSGQITSLVSNDATLGETRAPITHAQQAIIDAEGGFESFMRKHYGANVTAGLQKLPGTTPEEHAMYVSRAQQIAKKNPGMAPKDVARQAQAELFAEQQQGQKPGRLAEMLTKGGKFAGNTMIWGSNLPIQMINALASGGSNPSGPTALLPEFPYLDEKNNNPLNPTDEAVQNLSLADILKQSKQYYSSY